MRLCLGLMLALQCCAGGGCGKKNHDSLPKPDTTQAVSAEPAKPGSSYTPLVPRPLPPNNQAIDANGSAEAAASQLSLELRRYIAYTRSIPKNFEDFVAHDPIRFPPPPAGKKYVIAEGKVLLK